jgi:ankyrin repeat protein
LSADPHVEQLDITTYAGHVVFAWCGAVCLVQVATKNLDLPTMQLLLEHEADVAAAGQAGRSALHIAVSRGSQEAAAMLLEAGADINCT